MFKLCRVTMLALLVAGPILVSAQHPQELVTATNYRTDDGQQRKEAVDGQGNVRGEYSYVDPNGKTITVRYTAGKDGFKVEGDHLPVAPQPLPVQQPQQPQYNPPQNHYNPPQNHYNPPAPQPQYNPSGQFQSAQQQLLNFPSLNQPQNSLYNNAPQQQYNPPQQQYQPQPQFNNYQAPSQQQYNPFQGQQQQQPGQVSVSQSPNNAGYSYSYSV